jgi:hypothetical protein
MIIDSGLIESFDMDSYFNDGNLNVRTIWKPASSQRVLYIGCTVFHKDGTYRDLPPILISDAWDVWNFMQFFQNQTTTNTFNISLEEMQQSSRVVVALWENSPSPTARRLANLDLNVDMILASMRDSWIEDIKDATHKVGENVTSATDIIKYAPYIVVGLGALWIILNSRKGK